MPEEDRATDRGNMQKKIGKDRVCGSEDVRADRETHRQTYSSQYFATAPARKVINSASDWLKSGNATVQHLSERMLFFLSSSRQVAEV